MRRILEVDRIAVRCNTCGCHVMLLVDLWSKGGIHCFNSHTQFTCSGKLMKLDEPESSRIEALARIQGVLYMDDTGAAL